MGSLHVRKQGEIARNFVPVWKRYNDWDEDTPIGTVQWTLTAPPLPPPPNEVLDDPIVSNTIRDHPEYFPIITPVNIPNLHTELQGHPNLPLTTSVETSLTFGFWPLVKTFPVEYPITHDESTPTPEDPVKAAFLRDQRDVELSKNRYSSAFPHLLPGMYCMPIHAVPKDNGEAMRLVTDHSHGPYSLNSLIDKCSMPKAPLDNMRAFGTHMIAMQQRHPGKKLIAWKSDVAEAYRLIPMHPYWQIKQVERVDGQYHVNRCNVFGGRASQLLFISFMALVSWVAVVKRGISELCAYSDDHFGLAVEGDTTWYAPYNRSLPSPQARLLLLWDDLGIPHKEKKQISGNPLVIIGISVDVNSLELSLSKSAITALLDELEYWVSTSTTPAKRGCTLRQWQHLTGWINWALNVFPLVKPALSCIYEKMRGKTSPMVRFRPNNAIRNDLRWAISHIRSSPGIRILDNLHWHPSEADFTIYCDASLTGMGFYSRELHLGFTCSITHTEDQIIFYNEALCVLSALTWLDDREALAKRIVIYTDNTNTVDIFNSLRASPRFNPILIHACDILLRTPHDLKVLYVPGERNLVADALSRGRIGDALRLDHLLQVESFEPPLSEGGVAK
ncbi:hypothetical protein BJ165DRAFT_1356210 [Panaeolus papilionaceus]|nr:hypothetical protein BJ165DRAFT_1356210 [Panaeolus papilionaceus]